MEIWAHRGACHFAPENTLIAFQMAVDMGADGVELDIQLTRDNELVVIHDETVDRTSDGHGSVKDFTLSKIKKLNCNKGGKTPSPLMEMPERMRSRISDICLTPPDVIGIPTLEEVFALLKPTGLAINIELKTGIVFYEGIEEKALALAGRCGMLDRIVWSSFNHYSVQNLKRLEPAADTALLCGGGILVTGEECEKTGATALHPNISQLRYPGLVDECHARGVKVRAWTVNGTEDFELAKDRAIDGVFTNRIDSAGMFFKRKDR